MSSHLPSISEENLPVGYEAVADGVRYQVAFATGRHPGPYWKRVGVEESSPKQLKISVEIFNQVVKSNIIKRLNEYDYRFMDRPLDTLIHSALKYLDYKRDPYSPTEPQVAYIFNGYELIQEVVEALENVCLAIAYDLWKRAPLTYMYALVKPWPPSTKYVPYIYDEDYIEEIGQKLPDKTVFRTDDEYGHGVYYTYNGQIYQMNVNHGGYLVVSFEDIKRLTLVKTYLIEQGRAIYQIDQDLWFNAIEKWVCADPNCEDILDIEDLPELADNPIYQTLLIFIGRTVSGIGGESYISLYLEE